MKSIQWIIMLLLLVLPATFSHAIPPAPPLQTGQMGCSDEQGNSIDCSGSGQDGELRYGLPWPEPRFTDNGNQTVTDNLTGLTWSSADEPCGTEKSWSKTLAYIKALNTQHYLGANDWRLPNIVEMKSLLSFQMTSQKEWLLSQGFANIQSCFSYLLTSTSYPFDPTTQEIKVIDLYTGLDVFLADSSFNFWPVRTGQPMTLTPPVLQKSGQVISYAAGDDGNLQIGIPWPLPRFTDNGDQTMTDNLTGLVWTKNASPFSDVCGTSKPRRWQQALDYVKCLNDSNFLGHNDWALPNANELFSMVNHGESNNINWLKSQGYSNIIDDLYWSSSSMADHAYNAFNIDFRYGRLGDEAKTSFANVWPVRSGQYWTADSLLIAAAPKFGKVYAGKTAPARQVEILNRSSASKTVNYIGIVGQNSGDFSIAPGGRAPCQSLSPTLTAGESCTLLLEFKPEYKGEKYAYLAVAGNNQGASIPLSGKYVSVTTKADPPGGTYYEPQTVTLTANEPATIYYTSNGEEPTVQSPQYLAPLSVSYSKTLKFFAVDGDGNHEPVKSEMYTLLALNGACGPVNGGVFQNVPTDGLCSAGKVSAVQGAGPWRWSCLGSNGGSNASCGATNALPVSINGGAPVTNSAVVTLTFISPAGEKAVRVSNDGVKWGVWLSLKSATSWKLTSGDGVKKIFAQFGNGSVASKTLFNPYVATIRLDSKAPSGSITINGGAPYTNGRQVSAHISLKETTSEVIKVCLKEDKLPCVEEDFSLLAETLDFTISSPEDGKKTIYATLKDPSGNISKPVKARIILDTIPPTGSILINGGKSTTLTPNVKLKLTAVKAAQMQLSLDGGSIWGGWEKFASGKLVTLLPGPGNKVVKVKFRDLAGNESPEYTASITLQ